MQKFAALFLIIFSFVFFPMASFAAYESTICTSGETCTVTEVGPFMQNISTICGNQGTCSLDDIKIVFINVGQFVLGIIGAIVLLMYIIGGMYLLLSHGETSMVTKGKEYIKISTIGLLIVMSAYIVVVTILTSLDNEGPDTAIKNLIEGKSPEVEVVEPAP